MPMYSPTHASLFIPPCFPPSAPSKILSTVFPSLLSHPSSRPLFPQAPFFHISHLPMHESTRPDRSFFLLSPFLSKTSIPRAAIVLIWKGAPCLTLHPNKKKRPPQSLRFGKYITLTESWNGFFPNPFRNYDSCSYSSARVRNRFGTVRNDSGNQKGSNGRCCYSPQ